MKHFIYILALSLYAGICSAQAPTNITEIARFIIQDARFNQVDVTEQYINGNVYLVFYRVAGNDQIYFANVWPIKNTQSYGRIYNLETTSQDATTTEYKNETYSFKWSYINDYDKKEGTASMKLGLIYKPNGTAFILTMIPETLDAFIYKGYVAGSLNFGK